LFIVESEQNDRNTDILVFGRDKDGIKYTKRISDFRPYFYVLESEEVPIDFRITGVEKGYTSILGKPVKKIYARRSSDVADLREIFKKSFEADILFAQRYIIDEIGEIEPYPLRILYFDIELNTHKELPDIKSANQEITCISLLDSFTDNCLVLMWKYPDYKGDLKETSDLKLYDSEKELLEAFLGYLIKYDPDVISGWNCEKFDLMYLLGRMDRLGIESNKLSPIGKVSINDKYEEVTIKGRIVFDMMRAYEQYRKMSNQGQAESYSLEYTANKVLGKGKMKHKETFSEMWEKTPEKLAEYNALDVRLVKEINDKLDVITFFNSLRCKACAQLRQIYFTSILIDGLLLRTCKGEIVFPSKPGKTGDEEKFSGAFVFKPVPGVYENAVVYDVKGMYPAIIKTFNIGYETFNPKGEIQISEGIGFNRGAGIIPKVLTNLQQERDSYKKKMKFAYANGNETEGLVYHYKQYAIKVLMNAMFGYLGYPNSRLYKKEVANAITTMGRELSIWINEFITKQGYKVIYSDTDSCCFVSNKTTIFDIISDSKKLLDSVNKSFEEVVKKHGGETCYIEMEFEKVYKSIIFVSKRNEEGGAKKKYAVLPYWINGKIVKDKIEYTGFDAVRSDSPRIAREIQETVLDMILRKKQRTDVDAYLKSIYDNIISGKVSEVEVGFPKRIKASLLAYKTAGPIVNGALYSNKYLGTRFSRGDKPKFMYIRAVPPGYPNTSVITYEEKIPDGFIPDWDKVMERIFKMKLEDIYRVKGWEWDWKNIKEVKQQTLGF